MYLFCRPTVTATTTISSWSVHKVNFLPGDLCSGGLQVDTLDSSQLLVSVCSPESLNQSAAIGYLPVADLSGPAFLVYGNVTNSRPGPGLYADGLGSLADVVVPEHIYQTRDGSRILFVDTKSCARVVNRTSGQVTTILGDCIQLLYLIVIVYKLFWNIPSSLNSTGVSILPDETAFFKFTEDDLKLGNSFAQLDISADGITLLIADRVENKLLQFNTQTADPDLEEGTWWVVLAVVSGFCVPLFIIWVVVKVIQVKRNGFVFDIFDNEDEVFESKTWRNINFLYNRAAKGYDYHCRGQSKGATEPVKKRSKSKAATKSGSKKLQSATEAITSKFKLPKLRKKKNFSDGSELKPVKENPVKVKSKPKISKRDSVDIEYAGGKVSVPLTKTLVGRARPLPDIPVNRPT
ncbi:hypothetical protein EB796_022652 [Bugula neritina]|uniref:Uncharacterized protein n=1 Tax=Bugula neritina TaxID=10212 RepID=A0A7J7J051_BUGNE|nr:hypothetical protein EB796_022652 [Bugula neritina]